MKNGQTTQRSRYKYYQRDGETIKIRSTAVKYYDENGNAVFKKHIPENNILTNRNGFEKVLFTIMFAVLALHCISLFLPVLWIFISSFKDYIEYAVGDPFALPVRWEAENYLEAITMLNAGKSNFLGMIVNSLWYTGLSTALRVFCPLVTAYIVSKYRFFGRDFLYALTVTVLTIPIVGTSGSMLKLCGDLGIYDSPWYVVCTSLSGFTGIFLVCYGFYKSVSWSYAEAAMIDGADAFRIFFKIMLPQALPIMLTYAITMGIETWQDYGTMLVYMPSWPTLASGLFEYQAIAVRSVDYPRYYAGLIISMIPTVTIFAVFSNKIMTSISIGGLKG